MLSRLLIGVIRLYQRLSRLWPPTCRFRPSCSEYMIQAIQIHGVWRGLTMGLRRIMRCHPWSQPGDDPVPPRLSSSELSNHSITK